MYYLSFALSTLCHGSSLDLTIKDGALGLPANIGEPGDVLAPTGGSLLGESFDGSFASLLGN
jgi:hypothetical protein